MARIETRRPVEDEEDIIDEVVDDEDVDDEEEVASPKAKDHKATIVRKDRDSVTPREQAKNGNAVTRFLNDVRVYFQEVRAELMKVTWLNREDTLRLTRIVLLVTAISALFLGLVGYLFGLLTQTLAATDASATVAAAVTIGLIVVVGGAWLFRDRLFANRFE